MATDIHDPDRDPVDVLAEEFARSGMNRMAARVFAALVVTDEGELTAAAAALELDDGARAVARHVDGIAEAGRNIAAHGCYQGGWAKEFLVVPDIRHPIFASPLGSNPLPFNDRPALCPVG